MKKNQQIVLDIQDMSVHGEGIGRFDGMPFFVANAVVGDRVTARITKMKKTYGYARLLSVDVPSPDRIVPVCPVADRCGGCSMMALSYDRQLAWKEAQVENALRRIGGLQEEMLARAKHPILGMDEPYHYRNKAQYPVGTDPDGRIVIGFYAPHSHRIIPVPGVDAIEGGQEAWQSGTTRADEARRETWQSGTVRADGTRDEGTHLSSWGRCATSKAEVCAIGQREDAAILAAVKAYMETCGVRPYDEATGKGCVRHILIRHGFATGEIMVCLVINGHTLPESERLVRLLRERGLLDDASGSATAGARAEETARPRITSIVLNENTRRDNVILGKTTRVLWGADRIHDRLLGNTYGISAQSFYQVNPRQTAKLYEKAVDYAGLTGTETVWDLYCGIGTIGLTMARRAGQVIGMETVADAVRDAEGNARSNGITNARFYRGEIERTLWESYGAGVDATATETNTAGMDIALTGNKAAHAADEAMPEGQQESGTRSKASQLCRAADEVMPEGQQEGGTPSKASQLCRAADEVMPEGQKEGGTLSKASPCFPTPDVIVVDPPRKGLDPNALALIDRALAGNPAGRLVYVSCNPATLARDVRWLTEHGFTLESYTPVDQFGHSGHVETVCLLSKLSSAKHHIEINVDMDELDLTSAEAKATYEEIRNWVQEKYGLHVTNLNIAQVKQKHGIIERENYNKPKSPDSKQPGCPQEKVKAIEDAMRHFQMI